LPRDARPRGRQNVNCLPESVRWVYESCGVTGIVIGIVIGTVIVIITGTVIGTVTDTRENAL
jgi:hypothetical protein